MKMVEEEERKNKRRNATYPEMEKKAREA